MTRRGPWPVTATARRTVCGDIACATSGRGPFTAHRTEADRERSPATVWAMIEILLAVIVVLLVIIGLLLARRNRHDSTDLLGSAMAARATAHVPQARDVPAGAEADFLVQQVRMLMNQRQKIPAVKLWRDATGVSLADAVKAVEQIAAGGTPSLPKAGVLPTAGSPVGQVLEPELMTNARDLKRQGRAIEAIKLVRRHTGLGLREAKDIVDRL